MLVVRLNEDELEMFSTRCHLYNGALIKKHSLVIMLHGYRCVSHKLGCDV